MAGGRSQWRQCLQFRSPSATPCDLATLMMGWLTRRFEGYCEQEFGLGVSKTEENTNIARGIISRKRWLMRGGGGGRREFHEGRFVYTLGRSSLKVPCGGRGLSCDVRLGVGA